MVKLVVTLLAVFCIVNFVDSAAVKSEEFADQLRRIIHNAYPDSLRLQRATESGTDSSKRNCYDNPCGWFAYNPQTRQAEVFMENTYYYKEYRYTRISENVLSETKVELCALSPRPDFYRLFSSRYSTTKCKCVDKPPLSTSLILNRGEVAKVQVPRQDIRMCPNRGERIDRGLRIPLSPKRNIKF